MPEMVLQCYCVGPGNMRSAAMGGSTVDQCYRKLDGVEEQGRADVLELHAQERHLHVMISLYV